VLAPEDVTSVVEMPGFDVFRMDDIDLKQAMAFSKAEGKKKATKSSEPSSALGRPESQGSGGSRKLEAAASGKVTSGKVTKQSGPEKRTTSLERSARSVSRGPAVHAPEDPALPGIAGLVAKIKVLEDESLKHREGKRRLREQLKVAELEKDKAERDTVAQRSAYLELQESHREQEASLKAVNHSLEQSKAAAKEGKAKRAASEAQMKELIAERDQLRAQLKKSNDDLAEVQGQRAEDQAAARRAEARMSEVEAKRLVLLGQSRGAVAEVAPCRGELLWEQVHHLSPELAGAESRYNVDRLVGIFRSQLSDRVNEWRAQWRDPANRVSNNVALKCDPEDLNPQPQEIFEDTGRWKQELDQIRGLILRVCRATDAAGAPSFTAVKAANPRSTARVTMVGQPLSEAAYAAGMPGEAIVADMPGPSRELASVPVTVFEDMGSIAQAMSTMVEQQTRLQSANELLQRRLDDVMTDKDIMRAVHEAELTKLLELAREAEAAGNRSLQAHWTAELAELREQFLTRDRSLGATVSGGPPEVPLTPEAFRASIEMREVSDTPPSKVADDLAQTMADTALLGDSKAQGSRDVGGVAASNVFGSTDTVSLTKTPVTPAEDESDSSSGSEHDA
jgi:predicted  nucleic acid-binding Zn-ribbon protein